MEKQQPQEETPDQPEFIVGPPPEATPEEIREEEEIMDEIEGALDIINTAIAVYNTFVEVDEKSLPNATDQRRVRDLRRMSMRLTHHYLKVYYKEADIRADEDE